MSYDEVQPRPEDVVKALDGYIGAVRRRYGSRLHSIVLFGGRARGDMRPDSDADVAVILEDGEWRFWHEKMLLADLAFEPFMESGLHIQPWPIARSAWMNPATHHNPRLVKAIKRDGKALLEPACSMISASTTKRTSVRTASGCC